MQQPLPDSSVRSVAITIAYEIGILFQYVNRATSCVRGALKEPAKRKAMAQEQFSFKASVWEAGTGVQGPKVEINTLKNAAGKQAAA